MHLILRLNEIFYKKFGTHWGKSFKYECQKLQIMVMAKINDANIHSWLCIMALGIEDHHG